MSCVHYLTLRYTKAHKMKRPRRRRVALDLSADYLQCKYLLFAVSRSVLHLILLNSYLHCNSGPYFDNDLELYSVCFSAGVFFSLWLWCLSGGWDVGLGRSFRGVIQFAGTYDWIAPSAQALILICLLLVPRMRAGKRPISARWR